jgi:hypothetical protein
MTLTAERVRELLSYNPETGVFTWLVDSPKGGQRRAGKAAGSVTGDGYHYISIRRRPYLAHRLAWLYVHGEWPSAQIDHRDGNRTNNAIDNLREANRSQNAGNSKRRRTNTSGFKGVYFCSRTGRYVAQITCGYRKHLGYFDTSKDAHAAYAVAAEKHFGEFARLK